MSLGGEEIISTADQLPHRTRTPDMTGNPASAADPLDTLFEQQYSDPDVDLYEVVGTNIVATFNRHVKLCVCVCVVMNYAFGYSGVD